MQIQKFKKGGCVDCADTEFLLFLWYFALFLHRSGYFATCCSFLHSAALTTATDLIMFYRVRTGGRITESLPTSNLSSTPSSSAPLAALASVMTGGGAGTHIATSHDDTSEGAVHCFRDEHGNWQSYTFAEKGTGTANMGMMPIAAAAAATANGKLLSTLLRYYNPTLIYMSLSCTLICCLMSLCTTRLHFTPWERPGTHFTGGWVGPRAGLDGWKMPSSPGFDPRPSSP